MALRRRCGSLTAPFGGYSLVAPCRKAISGSTNVQLFSGQHTGRLAGGQADDGKCPREGMTVATLVVVVFVIAILIFVSALFSGLETALFSLKPHQLRRLEQHHRGLTQFIQVFRDNPRRVLNLLLLGDALINVPLVILCLVLIWEVSWGRHIPQWMAAVVIFTIVVVLCDLIPKLLALSAPYRLSAIGAFGLQMSLPLLDRMGDVLERVSARTVDFLTPSQLPVRSRLSDEELETLLEMGE